MTTYSKLSTAKTIATKMARRHGVPYTTLAVEGGFKAMTVEAYEANNAVRVDKKSSKTTRTDGGALGSKIPCGPASVEEQISAVLLYADLTDNVKIKNFMSGVNPDYLAVILGKSKTRWGAIGNIREAVAL